MKCLGAAIVLTIVVVAASYASADYNDGVVAYDRGDYETARREWRALAELGDPASQHRLAVLYARGEGVPLNNAQAVMWWRMAALQGYTISQFKLGAMYGFGLGVPQDDAEAVKWYRKAAEGGVLKAQHFLGVMYSNQQQFAEAGLWYRLAAEQGSVFSQTALGLLYAEGRGVPLNVVRAHMWFSIAGASGEFGENSAREYRDKIAKFLTPSQIKTAQAMARNCVATNYQDC